jgi:hypothetical protein
MKPKEGSGDKKHRKRHDKDPYGSIITSAQKDIYMNSGMAAEEFIQPDAQFTAGSREEERDEEKSPRQRNKEQ